MRDPERKKGLFNEVVRWTEATEWQKLLYEGKINKRFSIGSINKVRIYETQDGFISVLVFEKHGPDYSPYDVNEDEWRWREGSTLEECIKKTEKALKEVKTK